MHCPCTAAAQVLLSPPSVLSSPLSPKLRTQANKNLLLKARVGTDAAVASAAFKAWWQPSFTFALSGGYDLQRRKPRIGCVFNCENYGNIRCGTAASCEAADVRQHT